FGSATASSPIGPCASTSLMSSPGLPNRLTVKTAPPRRAEQMAPEEACDLSDHRPLTPSGVHWRPWDRGGVEKMRGMAGKLPGGVTNGPFRTKEGGENFAAP